MNRSDSQRYVLEDSVTLNECPDTVERLPESHGNIFICGTYQLLEQSDESTPAHLMNRTGSVRLFSVENSKLAQQSVTKTEAILDCKWCPKVTAKGYSFCTADAKGMVNFYEMCNKVSADNTSMNNINMFSSICAVKEGLALSVDWSPDGSSIACSGSNGYLSITSLKPEGSSVASYWEAHNAEAWITAFDLWNQNILYSGADDCKFRGWDVRSKSSTFANSSHDAGVCSIQCNPLSSYIVATGSYDENVRIWDTRSIRKSPISQVDTKGGVWRIKWNRIVKDKMIVASMYAGFAFLDFADCTKPTVVAQFNAADGSLAYGVDWLYNENFMSVVSCTFYDRELFIGSMKPG